MAEEKNNNSLENLIRAYLEYLRNWTPIIAIAATIVFIGRLMLENDSGKNYFVLSLLVVSLVLSIAGNVYLFYRKAIVEPNKVYDLDKSTVGYIKRSLSILLAVFVGFSPIVGGILAVKETSAAFIHSYHKAHDSSCSKD